ncbi:hypothetical protein [Actinomadura rudentiformis]|uniref:Uncharacterized protein n=1 Tax=Actinomadura rudentiformis TaxID=359158 RepID=A0A6H9YST7_9ACTN|nr:hypothetical protein [Actinomadura rudentiformis]KAB2347230.1 hypothetical protein F8566_19580 [Actinomadura rudentiformis]
MSLVVVMPACHSIACTIFISAPAGGGAAPQIVQPDRWQTGLEGQAFELVGHMRRVQRRAVPTGEVVAGVHPSAAPFLRGLALPMAVGWVRFDLGVDLNAGAALHFGAGSQVDA